MKQCDYILSCMVRYIIKYSVNWSPRSFKCISALHLINHKTGARESSRTQCRIVLCSLSEVKRLLWNPLCLSATLVCVYSDTISAMRDLNATHWPCGLPSQRGNSLIHRILQLLRDRFLLAECFAQAMWEYRADCETGIYCKSERFLFSWASGIAFNLTQNEKWASAKLSAAACCTARMIIYSRSARGSSCKMQT